MSVSQEVPVKAENDNSQDAARTQSELATLIKWNYLNDESIKNKDKSFKLFVEDVKNNKLKPIDLFYEIFLSLNEFPDRLQSSTLVTLTNNILDIYNDTEELEKRKQISIEFLLMLQMFSPKQHTYIFIKQLKINQHLKKQYLDPITLERSGIFATYRKYYFKDAKLDFSIETYSSLYESSEGYAKFLIESDDFLNQDHSFHKIDYFIQVIERLIGHFKLDTNRCFLLLLSVFAMKFDKHKETILQFFKKSFWWKEKESNRTLQEMIVSYLQKNSTLDEPCNELSIIVLLIKENFFEFHSIFNSLRPLDFEMDSSFKITSIGENSTESLYERYKEEATEKSMQATASALALAAPLVLDDDEDDDPRNRNMRQSDKVPTVPSSTAATTTTTTTTTTDTTTAITEATKPVEKKVDLKTQISQNHKITFLKYALKYRMYDESLFILSQYPFLPLIDDRISKLINELVDDIITPFYEEFVSPINISGKEKATTKNIPIISIGHPVVSSSDELIKVCQEFLKFNDVKVATNPTLFTKLIRIIKKNCESLNTGEVDEKWLQFYRTFIFKSLPFVENMPVVNEAFQVMKSNFSLQQRYNLYGEFQTITIKNNLEIKLKNNVTEKKTKDILKRLSKENLSVMMRQLTKISFSNPLAVSNTFVNHIENYISLSDLIVESSKFFNEFMWDTLTFQLCNKLNSNRLTMQDDGLNHMQWIQNLSVFIGKLSRTCIPNFQTSPLLTLIIKSLNSGSTDLIIVLKEMISSMSGIQNINNLTPRQIQLLNGGLGLRKLIYMVIQDDRLKSKASSEELIKNLIANKQLNELFILLCNLSNKIVENSKDPLKILNLRCDELNSLIHMFTTMIEETDKDLTNELIPINELIEDFKIKPEWCFQIWRKQLNISDDAKTDEIVDKLPLTMNKINWNHLPVKFYIDFWKLSLYEINFNSISYKLELRDIKSQIENTSKKIKNARRDPDFSRVEFHRLESSLTELNKIVSVFKKDESKHLENFNNSMAKINNNKLIWFDKNNETEAINNVETSRQIIEFCLLPRLIHSSFDAVFSYEFIFLIHGINTPNFSLLNLLNVLFNGNFILATLFTNTGSETENLGIFYFQVLKKLNGWRKDERLYNKEALGLKTEAESKDKAENEMDVDIDNLVGMMNEDKLLSYTDFCKVLFNWHKSLLRQINSCLLSSHYTTRNNSISFLKNLVGQFPTVSDHSHSLIRILSKVSKTDKRDDIKLASSALFVLLSSTKLNYIEIWDFYEIEEVEKKKLMDRKEEYNRKQKLIKEAEEKKKAAAAANTSVSSIVSDITTTSKPYGLVGLQKKGPSKAVEKPTKEEAKTTEPSKEPTRLESKDESTKESDKDAEVVAKDVTDTSKQEANTVKKDDKPLDSSLKTTTDVKEGEDEPKEGPKDSSSNDAVSKLVTRMNEEKRLLAIKQREQGNSKGGNDNNNSNNIATDKPGTGNGSGSSGSIPETVKADSDPKIKGSGATVYHAQREAKSLRRDYRDSSDSRDPRDQRDSRVQRDQRDSKTPRDSRDHRDSRDQRDYRDSRDHRDYRDSRDSRESRDYRSTYTTRNNGASNNNGAPNNNRQRQPQRPSSQAMPTGPKDNGSGSGVNSHKELQAPLPPPPPPPAQSKDQRDSRYRDERKRSAYDNGSSYNGGNRNKRGRY